MKKLSSIITMAIFLILLTVAILFVRAINRLPEEEHCEMEHCKQ